MNPNKALAGAITTALDVSDFAKKAAPLQRKLLAAFIDPLLAGCDLTAARTLGREHGEVLGLALRAATPAQLKALSKKWNPHRLSSINEALPDALINELTLLATGRMQPAQKSVKAGAARSRRKAAAIAAE